MRSTYKHVNRNSRREIQPGEAIFKFIVGGAKQKAWQVYLEDGLGMGIFVDVEHEINKLRLRMRHQSNVKFVVLGEGATTYSLAELADQVQRRAVRTTSNTLLHYGAGARQFNSELAAQLLETTEDFNAFMDSIVDIIYVQTQGSPKLVRAEFFCSAAGAVGWVLSRFMAKKLAKAVSRADINCHIEMDLLGPIAFAGVSERARPNAASAIPSIVHYATHCDDDFEKSTCKVVHFHELVPCGSSMEKLTEFIILDRLARSGEQTKAAMAVALPNYANNNEIGAIMSRDVDFYYPLDRAKDMASVVAKHHFRVFKDAIDDVLPDKSIVKGIEFDVRTRSLVRRLDVQAILAACGVETIEGTIASLDRPEYQLSHTMRIVAAPGTTMSDVIPEQVDRTMSEYPQTLVEYVEKLSTFLTLHLVVSREIQAIKKELSTLNQQIAFHKQRLAKIIARVRGKKVVALSREVLQLARFVRESADKRENLESQYQAAERGLYPLSTEIAFLQANQSAILATLDQFSTRDTLASKEPAVDISNIDQHFAEYQHLPTLTLDEQVNLLCRSASHVTRAGLSRILRTDSDRIEAIAQAIVFGKYPTVSPSYAGQSRSFYHRQFYSIPPCDSETESRLTDAIQKIAPSAIVEFYEDITHGACICRVTLRRFAKLSDLFPRVVGTALHDGMTDKRSALNSRDGFKSVEELGGRVVDDTVEFDDDSKTNGATNKTVL
jgi:hypothetical protein